MGFLVTKAFRIVSEFFTLTTLTTLTSIGNIKRL